MKKIFFHIGNFKTGTSSIQAAFSQQSAELEAQGIHYFQNFRAVNNPTNHSLFALELLASASGDAIKPFWYQESHHYPALVDQLVEEIQGSTCNFFVFSSEEFCRCKPAHAGLLATLRQRLKEAIPDCEIIVLLFVRHPFDFVKSWYNQINKVTAPYADRTANFLQFFLSKENAFWSQYPIHQIFLEYFADQSLCAFYSKGIDSIPLFCSMLNRHGCGLELSSMDSARENIARVRTDHVELLRLVHRGVSFDAATLSRALSIPGMVGKINQINQDFEQFLADGVLHNPPDAYQPLTFSDLFKHYTGLLDALVPYALINQKEINLLRDKAIKHQHDFPSEALICLQTAQRYRPNGPLLKKLIQDLKAQIQSGAAE